jgi:hypothetical protein
MVDREIQIIFEKKCGNFLYFFFCQFILMYHPVVRKSADSSASAENKKIERQIIIENFT